MKTSCMTSFASSRSPRIARERRYTMGAKRSMSDSIVTCTSSDRERPSLGTAGKAAHRESGLQLDLVAEAPRLVRVPLMRMGGVRNAAVGERAELHLSSFGSRHRRDLLGAGDDAEDARVRSAVHVPVDALLTRQHDDH